MTTPVTKSKSEVLGTSRLGSTIPFDSIQEPGAYICRWSGHLLRVGEGALSRGAPRINFIGQQPLMVTKIDDDPSVPLATARLRAANGDVRVNF